MTKRLLLIIALLCAFAQGAHAQNYDVWDGHSEQQPTLYGYWVLIDNAANLAYVRNHWNDIASGENPYYKMGLYLRADLDMSAASWIPLGFDDNDYEGTFDGNGHTIKIRIEGGDDNGRALFDEIDEWATVKNLHVDGYINVGDAAYVAGIVSDNNGLIENCWVSANITSNHYDLVNDADLGGIAGQNSGLIRYCCMTGNVTNTAGNSGVGGLVGRNNGRDYIRSPGQPLHAGIYHCTFYGSVSVDHDQDSKYVGQNNGSTHYQYDAFNQTEYDSASDNNMYRRAIKYPYSVTVNTVGPGSIRTEAAGEYDVPGTYPDATFTLHVTSGSVARVTITDADGNDIPLQGQANDGSSYWFVMEHKNITAKFVFYENWPTQGTGTEEDPYLISSADDWNKFAHNVTYGRSYSGKYVKLTNDISVTTMAGGYQADDNYQPFSGTFDGDGHTLTLNVNNQSRFAAPFKCVSGATIKNLRTAGTIDGTGNADGKLLAGIIGVSFGNTTITGCRSSVTLTTDFGEDAALAGLVAGTKGGSLTIAGCAFDGSMTGASNTRCAGIAGYEYTATTTTISDCLFAPTTLTVNTAENGYTKTISRDPDATITNCYYTHSLGAAQGTACYFGAATVPNTFGDTVTDYGVVKAYANGLFFNGKYYYSDAGSEENPYIIDSEDALARIASIVNSGVSDFVGKHFSLICDLDLSGRNWTPIGNTVGTSFKGNFDGNNHTISNLTVNNPSGDYNGLFGYVEGVILEPGGNDPGCDYIRNFVVKNANVRGRDYTGGVAGHVLGKLIFENVILDGATVEGADYTSGFIGFAEGIQIWLAPMDAYSPLDVQNCLFINGSVTANNAAHIYSSFDHPRSSFVMFGEISTHSFFTSCYFNNVVYNGAAAQEDYYNVQAYPVIVNAPSNINCEFLFAPIYVPGQAVPDNYVSAAGIDYNGNYYIPGTTPFRLSYNDYQYRVTSVKINGVEVGTNIGEYVLNAGGSPIDSYTVTVEYEPGLTGSGTEDDPYLITSTELWDWFAISVNNGAHYSGKYVKLAADIDITTSAGSRVSNTDNKPFSGTFLGDGHTITVTLTDDGKQGLAPFRYIDGATIKNLKVAGTIASSQYHSAGVVGFANGTNTIEGCVVTATLNISNNYAGGIIGHGLSSNTTIRGCVFAGTINGVDGNRENIGGIWGWSNSGTPTLENCLEAGTYTNIASMHPMGLQGGSGTITNCYYVNPQIGSPTNACTVSGAAPGNVRTITGYGSENNNWAFIASPLTTDLNPATIEGLIGSGSAGDYNYDMFRLNTEYEQWENYVQHTDGFVIANGTGYLYAKQSDVTLTFTGTYNVNNTKEVNLQQGFNLVGNPFPRAAWVDRSYYKMNDAGTDIEVVENFAANHIEPCYGIVVKADNTDESIMFSTSAPQQQSANNNGNLQMTLTKAGVRSDAFQDKAIVSFNEGSQLEKFVFNERHAKLYIPQYGEDYAIASSEMTGEIPLNFKTNETGRYTIGFNFENVKGVRIQLIDKLEDIIIDLNANDSYTFMGSTVDRSDRFTLVFTQVETGSIFAYQEGNDIIVSGEGELQVFDLMGRKVATQRINGVQTITAPQNGVYILRLNGKTQKIVVR